MRVRGYSVPDAVITAIRERRPLRLRYHKEGKATGSRLIHPHALWESHPGVLCLHGVQVEGPSSTGYGSTSLAAWRTFDLGLVDDLQVQEDQQFAVDPEFRPESPLYKGNLVLDCVRGWST